MNINYNGKEIELGIDDGMEDMFELMCVCGHKLREHSYTHAYGTMERWITSQCIRCGFTQKDDEHPEGFVCEQFRISPAKNDAKWLNFPGLNF